ncbi:MAG: gfo/Idh/MocA family oxidoreductase, partial [Salinibacter sp.]
NTAVNAHLGNIAFRVGQDVTWDAEQREFVDSAEANALVRPSYRNPWSLPSV